MTGEQWVAERCGEEGIDWDKLTPAQRFKFAMRVPCDIRCFRVGGPVQVVVGEECPECGKFQEGPTRYEQILGNEDDDGL